MHSTHLISFTHLCHPFVIIDGPRLTLSSRVHSVHYCTLLELYILCIQINSQWHLSTITLQSTFKTEEGVGPTFHWGPGQVSNIYCKALLESFKITASVNVFLMLIL